MTNKSLVVAVGIAALSLSAGCRTNNSSVFIRQVPIPDPQNKCTVSADPTTAALPSGTFDTSLTSFYQQFFLFGDQLVQRGDASRLRPETSRVQMFEARADIFKGGALIAEDQRTPTNGFADAANETTPGWGLALVSPLISPDVAKTIMANGGGQVVARVRLFGSTLGGLDVETGPFDFPIFVCGNDATHTPCLPKIAPPTCTETKDYACIPGQDTAHDCRQMREIYLARDPGAAQKLVDSGFCVADDNDNCAD
jgi:hypothetical protein